MYHSDRRRNTHSIPTGIHHHVHIRHDRSKTAASPRMYSARGRLPWQGELMLHSICLLNSCLRDRGHEFLPHDAMQKRSLCHQAVSVCLSVTFVDCVKSNKYNFNFFQPSGSHAILVFPYQTSWQYSDGDSPNGASNAGEVG